MAFIIFDIMVNGWWLMRDDVKFMANEMNIPVVPTLGIMRVDSIVEYVRSKPQSVCSKTPQIMEGVVCRSEPLMRFRNGKPIMWKLKVRDFE